VLKFRSTNVCFEIRNRGRSVASMWEEQAFIRSQSVVSRVVAGETLIVPVRAKVGDLASIYSFNGTGSLIWRLLGSAKTVAELSAAVAREYEVDQAQAERDVEEFVGEMKAVGLVEVSASVAMAGD
jgi:Coenzyme PQQ synthesis protein D (PqqD)